MKSITITTTTLAISAATAVVADGVPRRKRTNQPRHHSVPSSASAVKSEEIYDPYLGLLNNDNARAERAAAAEEEERQLVALTRDRHLQSMDNGSTKMPTYQPTTATPTYQPTDGDDDTTVSRATAADYSAGVATADTYRASLLLMGAAGVWANMN